VTKNTINKTYNNWIKMSDADKIKLWNKVKNNGLLLINSEGNISAVTIGDREKGTHYPIILSSYQTINHNNFKEFDKQVKEKLLFLINFINMKENMTTGRG